MSELQEKQKETREVSAGIANERKLIQAINKLCSPKNPVNIVFTDGKKEFRCYNIIRCDDVSRKIVHNNPNDKRKADVLLIGKGERNKLIKYPISLKMDNASRYESADARAGVREKRLINFAIKNGKLKIEQIVDHKPRPLTKFNKPIAYLPKNTQEKESLMFGTDVKENGCIIRKTFNGIPYRIMPDGWAKIKVSKIYLKTSDARGKDNVVYIIGNSSDRDSKKLPYRGIRLEAFTQSKVTNTAIKFNGV